MYKVELLFRTVVCISCLNFACVGFVLRHDSSYQEKYLRKIRVPSLETFECFLYCQSVTSLWADVISYNWKTHTAGTYAVLVDRFTATAIGVSMASNLLVISVQDSVCNVFMALCFLGVYYLGRRARRNKETVKYVLLHTCWHCFPFAWLAWLVL